MLQVIIECGTTVLLQFRSLAATEKYIKSIYLNSDDYICYEMQYIQFSLTPSHLVTSHNISNTGSSDVHFVCTPIDQKLTRKRGCDKKSEKYEKKLQRNKKYKSMNYEKFKNSTYYEKSLEQNKKYKAANCNNFKNSEKYELKLEQHKHYKAANYDTFKNSKKYEQKLEQHKQYKAANYDTFKNSKKYEQRLEQQKQYMDTNYDTFKNLKNMNRN